MATSRLSTMSDYLKQGYAAMEQSHIEEAVQCFEKAVQQNPKDPESLACLGQSLFWLGDTRNGIIYLRKAAKLIAKKARKSKDVSDLLAITEQLQSCNDYTGSLEFAKQAVQIKHGNARSLQLLALTYSRLNQPESALILCQQAVKLMPDSTLLTIMLASLEADNGRYDKARQRLEKVLKSQSLAISEQFRTHKELARILDKLAEYDQVFEHLHAAAELAEQLPEVNQQDISLIPKLLANYKNSFDQELLGRWSDETFTLEPPTPVFLLGFLRSGTTLAQQVLDVHPKVFIADESDLILALRNELEKISESPGSTPELLKKIDLAGIKHLRQYYWDSAKKRYGDSFAQKIFIDKTSMNTIDLGLINCVFPDAKVIFVMRDPRDVCISCFMQLMAISPLTIQLLSWQNTATFYAQTMDWWLCMKQGISLDYLEFRYEDAVTQFEPTFRKAFAFLDLDWEPAVSEFHRYAAKKFIASPSFNQVIQPLYSSSIARWQKYKSECAVINKVLQPFIKAFGYER